MIRNRLTNMWLHVARFGRVQRCSMGASDVTLPATASMVNVSVRGALTLGDGTAVNGTTLSGQVEIGSHSSISGPNTFIRSKVNPVVIGDFVSIASGVLLQEYFHRTDRITTSYFHKHVLGGSSGQDIVSNGPIRIGSDVWIGSGAVVMSGVTVGHGAVVGANSVVTKDVEPYAVVGGAPARFIRYRFPEDVIERLLKSEWWLWEQDRLVSRREYFEKTIRSSADLDGFDDDPSHNAP